MATVSILTYNIFDFDSIVLWCEDGGFRSVSHTVCIYGNLMCFSLLADSAKSKHIYDENLKRSFV